MTIRKMRTTPKVTLTATGPEVILTAPESATPPRPCSSVPGAKVCCSLDYLVQPRFFCGQLLTDQDLTTLLRWAQDRLRLGRYRHGWGVVCGLDVRCDPQNPARVIVGPGYAVGCCGDDIIVGEDAPFDLSAACRKARDPCAELKKPEETESGPEPPKVVDLYIRYKEEPSDPQTALGRSVCREVAKCEYSRTRETFELIWQSAVYSDPVKAAAESWHTAYTKACLDVVKSFYKRTGSVKQWFLHWIAKHSLPFCFVRDWICQVNSMNLNDESQQVQMLLWLVQGIRNAFLTCDCHDCQESPGVPLARVWLQTQDDQSKQCCNVLAIDAYPPYRRPLSPECWPAPLGHVNLGQVVWHRWEDAWAKLAKLGVHVVGRESFEPPTSIEELKSAIESDCLFAGYGQGVYLLTADVETLLPGQLPLGERVVSFRRSDESPPFEPPEEVPGEDELTIIHGIGTERALRLREGGITSFEALAEAPMQRLEKLFPMVSTKTMREWQDEAKDLLD